MFHSSISLPTIKGHLNAFKLDSSMFITPGKMVLDQFSSYVQQQFCFNGWLSYTNGGLSFVLQFCMTLVHTRDQRWGLMNTIYTQNNCQFILLSTTLFNCPQSTISLMTYANLPMKLPPRVISEIFFTQ